MNGAAAGHANLLHIIFFGYTEFEQLWFAIFNHFHGCMHNRRFNAAATDGACQLTAFTDSQFGPWPARGRTGHGDDRGDGHPSAPRTPFFNISKHISHCNSPYLLQAATALRRPAMLRTGRLSSMD